MPMKTKAILIRKSREPDHKFPALIRDSSGIMPGLQVFHLIKREANIFSNLFQG